MIGQLKGNRSKLLMLARNILSSESGITLPTLAFSLVALLGFSGIAIDTARVQMAQAKLQFSLDAAGLAAGSTVNTANLLTEARKYLGANFNGYMGAHLDANSPSVVANNTNTVFTLSAVATVPTTFMGVLGVGDVTLNASSQITREITGLELVFVLDNTGSMSSSAGGGISKINALKNATTSLINTLFGSGNAATSGKLWIGMVPFSHAVNIGTSHPTWIGSFNPALHATWNGCVDARQGGYDVTDDTPSLSNQHSLFNLRSYTRCVTDIHGAVSCSDRAACTPNNTTSCTPIQPYLYPTPLALFYNYNQMPTTPPCAREVTRMTNDSAVLLSAVNAMMASGQTIISEGLVWGWRMLSPKWQGLWGGSMNANGLPLAYNTEGMIKAVVLLTDGENVVSAQGAYWFPVNGWTGSTSTNGAKLAVDAKTLSICNAMKEQGIYIYTIGLGTSDINTTLLQSCATAPNYAFISPSTEDLQNVFNSIGDSLANLRVSK